ncbi:50S ribosomal protein L11 methyltransferase [Clostridium chauvoei]|uniref:50S ribosomal protein L11 methyltransferase n=2 Tax=Clostridium chauvoei TaxID=46867 RepID=A0ABD4RHX3_9CLOT|nr:50S ribosomal protein L11 methyltransferase [Clostridium chauvoei]ATD55445.1 hypothetical protein BTM20_09450 [Clostridium chauvoei]ATD56882.1 hypothetical protein BTM21_03585 [Clostridium chauvoei]MBX7280660.1 50S ribosomal protein L11 methyltransferase [Clostridium chauvoei]MBX7283144.1 50S ribosomal protein L11 methyltransferase [Clostridium chauvoei]MBX7285701.1 50S ribosomal protein L11 methyltransferase [Clostridium chauvoei]
MKIISYNILNCDLDKKIELLQINDIFNFFYDTPLEITKDDYGYGYLEKNDSSITLKVAFDGEDKDFENFKELVTSLLETKLENIEEVNYDYTNYDFPIVEINNEWVLASPEEEINNKSKINFISQGAFGTGLHETTKDLLNLILTKLNLTNKNVLDIGTGSGILSIASSIAGASSVTAVDIRDVTDEVELNASLNGLYNIKVLIGDLLSDEMDVNEKFEWIYINIGGEETKMFMDFIKRHLDENGKILISGLVEWSFDEVRQAVENYGFKLQEKYQTNEWITAIFK